MPEPPQHKIQGTAVPKAADEKGDHIRRDGDHHPVLLQECAIQERDDRLEDVNPQESGEGDVPPFPKIGDIGRKIGVLEVLGHANAQHPAHPDGDVAVAGKVDVDVERIEHRGGNHSAPRSKRRNKRLVINGIRLYQRNDEQRFHRTVEDAAHAGEHPPRIEACVRMRHPVVEVVERVDGTCREGGEKEEVVDVRQEVAGAECSLITLNQPMDYTEQNVRKTYLLHRKEVLAKRVGPPTAEPGLDERVVADGEEDEQQREGSCEQRTRPPFPQEQSRTVGN